MTAINKVFFITRMQFWIYKKKSELYREPTLYDNYITPISILKRLMRAGRIELPTPSV